VFVVGGLEMDRMRHCRWEYREGLQIRIVAVYITCMLEMLMLIAPAGEEEGG
jgi:hypothetical protein